MYIVTALLGSFPGRFDSSGRTDSACRSDSTGRSDSASRIDSAGEAAQKCSYYIHIYIVSALLGSFLGRTNSAGRI